MFKDSGLIHSVKTTAANVHDLTAAAELLHGKEEVVFADAGYQSIEKRPEMEGKTSGQDMIEGAVCPFGPELIPKGMRNGSKEQK